MRKRHLKLYYPLLAETQVHAVSVLHKIKVVRVPESGGTGAGVNKKDLLKIAFVNQNNCDKMHWEKWYLVWLLDGISPMPTDPPPLQN